MKVVVTSYDGDQPIYNTRFLRHTLRGFNHGLADLIVPKRKAKWRNLFNTLLETC